VKFWFLVIFFSVFAIHLLLLQNFTLQDKTKVKNIVKITKIKLNNVVLEKKETKVKKEFIKKQIEPKEHIEKKIVPIQKPKPLQKVQKPKIVKRVKKRSKKVVKRYKKRASKHKKHIIKRDIVSKEIVDVKEDIVQAKHTNKNISKEEQLRYITLIREMIRENLFYPRVAKRMHIQGVVHISFVVRKDGDVTDIKILSSTSSILKRGAIKTIKSISPPPIPQSLGKSRLELSIPIEFRLKE